MTRTAFCGGRLEGFAMVPCLLLSLFATAQPPLPVHVFLNT